MENKFESNVFEEFTMLILLKYSAVELKALPKESLLSYVFLFQDIRLHSRPKSSGLHKIRPLENQEIIKILINVKKEIFHTIFTK